MSKTEMQGKLERLISLLHNRRFAEKIAAAETFQKAIKIYKREWKFIGKQVNAFAKEARHKKDAVHFVVGDSFKIKPKNAVEIGWILFMIKMDEDDLVSNYGDLREALNSVTGVKAKTATEMEKILRWRYLKQYDLYYLLGRFI